MKVLNVLTTTATVICLILVVLHYAFGFFMTGGNQYAAIGVSFAILFFIGWKSIGDADEAGSGKFCRVVVIIIFGLSILNILLVDSINKQILNQLILILFAFNAGIFQAGGPMPTDEEFDKELGNH